MTFQQSSSFTLLITLVHAREFCDRSALQYYSFICIICLSTSLICFNSTHAMKGEEKRELMGTRGDVSLKFRVKNSVSV